MFTWNFQYVSKARLTDTFNQLMLNSQKGDILIRIHTAIHMEDEAVDLARFIKNLVPGARIFGTSTSGIINQGKITKNQCVISVTQMDEGEVKTALLPTVDKDTGKPIGPDELCEQVRNEVIRGDTRLLLTFFTPGYFDIYRFIDMTNDAFHGVQMIGGVADGSEFKMNAATDSGFVFNEDGWSDNAILLAAIGGATLEALSSFAAGVQDIGEDHEITDSLGCCILEVDRTDAAREYRVGIGNELLENGALANLFPVVYSDQPDIPIYMRYYSNSSLESVLPKDNPWNVADYASHPQTDTKVGRELVTVNHTLTIGRKMRRGFIYDKKIVADNRALFRRIENFEKAETIFAFACTLRHQLFPNCTKWELSAYENSNMCGCVVAGEIVCNNGRNAFANGTFGIAVMGENEANQEFNPFAYTYTESLNSDNKALLHYFINVEKRLEEGTITEGTEILKEFVRECGTKLLASEMEDIPNVSAMKLDMRFKGYDRMCLINVADTLPMRTVFPEQMIRLTYKNYISKCSTFARSHNYHIYIINKWMIAIGAPSYMVALSTFVRDMEFLQKDLFEASEESIAIVPMFCVVDGGNADNIESEYNLARLDMMNKNLQFMVRRSGETELDEQSIREHYRIVNVINYAIAHNKVIPYYQGIYDNNTHRIHHYESLMRLMDETGKIYYPNSFLDAARQFGLLYDSISMQMIRKVFEKFLPLENTAVSINLGYRDIKNREILDFIYDSLSTAKHPENFIFEILENEDIADYNTLVEFVSKIHELGALIAIDDFGSGFSNLQHIVSIHSDYIKIDGSIVRKCCESAEAENLIALIAGWKELSSRPIRIVAEFVENEEIQNKLMKYRVDFSQGYLFAKPEPEIAEDAAKPKVIPGVAIPLT